MVPWLGPDDPFPSVERALGAASGAPGLLAASADLLPARLIDAYRHGIFPWYSDGQPVLWWSPEPRMILRPDEFKVAPSLRKTLKRVLREDAWEIRVDHDFASVMRACAQAPRRGQRGTWITADVVEAVSVAAPGWRRTQHRDLVRRQARGRTLRRVVRQDVLWRIDVRRGHGCFENRALRACRPLATSQNRNDRLPAEHVASGVAGRSRDCAQGVHRACPRVCRCCVHPLALRQDGPARCRRACGVTSKSGPVVN